MKRPVNLSVRLSSLIIMLSSLPASAEPQPIWQAVTKKLSRMSSRNNWWCSKNNIWMSLYARLVYCPHSCTSSAPLSNLGSQLARHLTRTSHQPFEHVEECVWAVEAVKEIMPDIPICAGLSISEDKDVNGVPTGEWSGQFITRVFMRFIPCFCLKQEYPIMREDLCLSVLEKYFTRKLKS